ncbi:MAG: hypothetical protein LBD79_10235, partial [Treponema sp.]|nr:hypothetical protein [Treponema sp.]
MAVTLALTFAYGLTQTYVPDYRLFHTMAIIRLFFSKVDSGRSKRCYRKQNVLFSSASTSIFASILN